MINLSPDTISIDVLALSPYGKALRRWVIQAMAPPLIVILLVLGSIFFGIATPTEVGAVGCGRAIALAAANRQLTWESLRQVCDTTLRITSMVIFILFGSTAFSLSIFGVYSTKNCCQGRLVADLALSNPNLCSAIPFKT